MIPTSLTIQGIYSYQEKQHIDFTKLTEAQLFGIFGSVGSGKSTILEAITFALYGESERLNKRENRNYNMMNLKSDELLIDFCFETGANRDLYRFIVQGKRNKKHFDKINTFDRKAYHWNTEQWLPLESADAEDLLGLSYENFKRTIIIPQGKFQEFLQLSETDRTRMLKEIFNLERFELSDKVGHIEKKNNQELDRLQGELQGMEEITDEARQEKVQAKEAKTAEKEKLEKHYKEQKERFDKLKNLKDLNEQYQQAQQKLESLQKQKPEFEQRQKDLEQFEKCQYHFKDKIDRSNELEKDIEERQKALEHYKKQKQIKDQELIKHQGKLHKIQEKFPEQKTLENSITDLQTLIEIRKFREQLTQQKEQLEKTKKQEKEGKQKLQKQKEEKQEIQERVEKLKKEKLDQGTLGAVKNWFTQKNNLEANIKNTEQEISNVQQQIEELKGKRKEVIEKQKVDQLKKGLAEFSVKELKPELEGFKDSYNQQIQKVENQLVHYQTRKELESYAQKLEEGESCPVCGSTHHPEKLQPGDAEEKIKELQKTKKSYQSWIEAINNTLQEIEGLKSNYQALKKQLDNNEERYEELKEQLDQHEKAFEWEGYKDIKEEKMDELLEQAQSQAKEVERVEKELSQKDKAIEEQNEKVQNVEKQTREKEQKVNSLEERINSYSQQLRLLKAKDYEETHLPDLEKQLQEWQQELEEFQELEKSIEKLQKEVDELRVTIRNKKEQLEEKQKEYKDVSDKLQHLIRQSVFENIGEVVKILNKELDVEGERKAIRDFQNQYSEQQGILKNLAEQLENKEAFRKEEFEELKQTLEKEEKQLQGVNNAIAVIDQQVQDLDKKLEKKKELNTKLEKLQVRQENIKTLRNLFKGSGFVKYVSSVFLKELCHAANERFYRLTRQQLRLEVTDDNNFQVRDFLNNGRIRNVKTLSGGQTFQASLSLALALAENIQRLTQSSQNFFFLDEGFGSQDQESLNIVFETLKSLRKENRIVGVISHVEALKEEIDVALNVENDPERGSLVKGSWEI